MVERGGRVRTFHVPVATKENVIEIVRENIAKESRLHTDESRLHDDESSHFAAHKTVKHSADEYVRHEDDETIHTNSAEGYFSVFKRGMRGIYQHCSEKHLHRYLASSIFGTTTAPRLDTTMKHAPCSWYRTRKASALPTINLVKPSFRAAALRFLRWRKKRYGL